MLGIVGAFVATYLGQAIGWYRVDQGAGVIGALLMGYYGPDPPEPELRFAGSFALHLQIKAAILSSRCSATRISRRSFHRDNGC